MGPIGRWGKVWIKAAVFGVVAVAVASAAPAAFANDLLYWDGAFTGQIQFANLNGTGGGSHLNTGTTTISTPEGIAIDPSRGRIYWTDYSANRIEGENLDGTGGVQILNTAPGLIGTATVNGPFGLGIDTRAGKLYWASSHSNTIGVANLNGTGGHNMFIGSAPISNPIGVAVDPGSGKIYWANWQSSTISFAFLDESHGGGPLFTSSADVSNPEGVAIDPAHSSLFWANQSALNPSNARISFANLSGTGGTDLNTGAAPVAGPSGVAIDPDSRTIYWGNQDGGQIGEANVDTGGGSTFNTTGTGDGNTTFPAILRRPKGTGNPAITGGLVAPTTLGCSRGGWAGDLPASQFYRAPQSFSFNWFKDGAPIPGANSNVLTAGQAGSYVCHVTARNFAGATTQSSAPFRVAPAASNNVSFTGSTSGLTGVLTVACHGIAGQRCSGPIVLTSHVKQKGKKIVGVTARKHRPRTVVTQVTVGSGGYNVAAGNSATVLVPVNGAGRKVFKKLLKLPATVSLPGTTAPPQKLTFRLPRINVNHNSIAWSTTSSSSGSSFVSAFSIVLTPLPVGAHVRIVCHGGGCPFGTRSAKAKKRSLNVTKLFGSSHLRPGTRVSFAISAVNHVGELVTYTMSANPPQRFKTACLPPGSSKPVKC